MHAKSITLASLPIPHINPEETEAQRDDSSRSGGGGLSPHTSPGAFGNIQKHSGLSQLGVGRVCSWHLLG